MPYAARTFAVALVSAAGTIAVALLSSARLADAPVRGRPQGPDPFGALASIAALGIGLAAFVWLGRSIGRDAETARPAIVAGALGGALSGLAGGVAQSFALADYLGAVLIGYAVPREFLTVALGTYVLLATIGAGVVGGGITYVAWHHERGNRLSRRPDTPR